MKCKTKSCPMCWESCVLVAYWECVKESKCPLLGSRARAVESLERLLVEKESHTAVDTLVASDPDLMAEYLNYLGHAIAKVLHDLTGVL